MKQLTYIKQEILTLRLFIVIAILTTVVANYVIYTKKEIDNIRNNLAVFSQDLEIDIKTDIVDNNNRQNSLARDLSIALQHANDFALDCGKGYDRVCLNIAQDEFSSANDILYHHEPTKIESLQKKYVALITALPNIAKEMSTILNQRIFVVYEGLMLSNSKMSRDMFLKYQKIINQKLDVVKQENFFLKIEELNPNDDYYFHSFSIPNFGTIKFISEIAPTIPVVMDKNAQMLNKKYTYAIYEDTRGYDLVDGNLVPFEIASSTYHTSIQQKMFESKNNNQTSFSYGNKFYIYNPVFSYMNIVASIEYSELIKQAVYDSSIVVLVILFTWILINQLHKLYVKEDAHYLELAIQQRFNDFNQIELDISNASFHHETLKNLLENYSNSMSVLRQADSKLLTMSKELEQQKLNLGYLEEYIAIHKQFFILCDADFNVVHVSKHISNYFDNINDYNLIDKPITSCLKILFSELDIQSLKHVIEQSVKEIKTSYVHIYKKHITYIPCNDVEKLINTFDYENILGTIAIDVTVNSRNQFEHLALSYTPLFNLLKDSNLLNRYFVPSVALHNFDNYAVIFNKDQSIIYCNNNYIKTFLQKGGTVDNYNDTNVFNTSHLYHNLIISKVAYFLSESQVSSKQKTVTMEEMSTQQAKHTMQISTFTNNQTLYLNIVFHKMRILGEAYILIEAIEHTQDTLRNDRNEQRINELQTVLHNNEDIVVYFTLSRITWCNNEAGIYLNPIREYPIAVEKANDISKNNIIITKIRQTIAALQESENKWDSRMQATFTGINIRLTNNLNKTMDYKFNVLPLTPDSSKFALIGKPVQITSGTIFDIVQEVARVPVLVLDLDLNIIFANSSTLNMLKASNKERILYNNFANYVIDNAMLTQFNNLTYNKLISIHGYGHILDINNQKLDVKYNCRLFRFDNKNYILAMFDFNEVDTQRYFNMIVNNISDIVFIADNNYNIKNFSNQFTSFGLKQGFNTIELLDVNLFTTIHNIFNELEDIIFIKDLLTNHVINSTNKRVLTEYLLVIITGESNHIKVAISAKAVILILEVKKITDRDGITSFIAIINEFDPDELRTIVQDNEKYSRQFLRS